MFDDEYNLAVACCSRVLLQLRQFFFTLFIASHMPYLYVDTHGSPSAGNLVHVDNLGCLGSLGGTWVARSGRIQ